MNVNSGPKVSYHVSDCLEKRWPFRSDESFETQRQRDVGKVFRGQGPAAVDSMLKALGEDDIHPKQKIAALKHLISIGAAADKKVVLLKKDVVGIVSALVAQDPVPELELHCCLMLRCIAVVAQGAAAIVFGGGMDALRKTIVNRNNMADRDPARVAAVEALRQVSSTWNGRCWLLGVEVNNDLRRVGNADPVDTPSQQEQDDRAQAMVDALVAVAEKDARNASLSVWCLRTLANLAAETKGAHFILIAGGLRIVSNLLELYSYEDKWTDPANVECEVIHYALLVVWNLGMDDVGKKEALDLPLIPNIYAKLLKGVIQRQHQLFGLKAALVGGISALVIHTNLKEASIRPLEPDAPASKSEEAGGEGNAQAQEGSPVNMLSLVVDLLRDTDITFDALVEVEKGRANVPEWCEALDKQEVASVVKNAVQAIRLTTELPKAREYLAANTDINVEWKLMRQIFYSTPWEQQFVTRLY